MGNVFQSVTDMAGGLLGQTSAQYQAKKAGQAADAANAQAAPLRQKAGNIYGDLSDLGTADRAQTGGYAPLAQAGNQSLNLATSNSPQVFNAYAKTNDIYNADPYALSSSEQSVLNSHLSDMQRNHDQVIGNWKASLAQRGITDPAAIAMGEANLRTGFDALREGHTASFHEQARQDREKAQAAAMQYLSGQQALGGQQVAEGVGGAQGTIAQGAGGLANVSGQASQVGLQQQQAAQQAAAQNSSALSGLLNLGGYALGGGFDNLLGGGGDKAATTAPAAPVTTVAPVYNPNGTYATTPYSDPLGINMLSGGF